MIREISLNEIRSKIDNGETVVFLEVGTIQAYEKMHIAGALHFPPDRVRELARAYLPNLGHQIIIYSGERTPEDLKDENVARTTAEELSKMGYGNLYHYRGAPSAAVASSAKEEWIKATMPVESIHYPPPSSNYFQYASLKHARKS
ncbi:MAG TPA: rhodanese-like domain-containing protein [Bdellovibrionota bacterium]|nr:rhodanese-like domain-containing protein [Bdellovibrionota bacterium]